MFMFLALLCDHLRLKHNFYCLNIFGPVTKLTLSTSYKGVAGRSTSTSRSGVAMAGEC